MYVSPRRDEFAQRLSGVIKSDLVLDSEEGLPSYLHGQPTEGMAANAYYFSQPVWMEDWIACVHRYPELHDRWRTLIGEWDGKVVVDVGCGPGNLFVALGGAPRLLIGVDVAPGSLRMAAERGYVPLLADAHDLPLEEEIADVVAINGSLHHCDDMEQVLREAARLVKKGGVLAIDHDPQRSAWNFRGLGRLMWMARMPVYRWLKRGGHSPVNDEQRWAAATELHHGIGQGTDERLFLNVLEPMGFEVELYPHNHRVGAELVQGKMGRAPLKILIAQLASGIWPGSQRAALSLFCLARRTG